MSTAKKRKTKKQTKGDITKRLLKVWPYIFLAFAILFLIYRTIILVSFKVDCSNIPTDMLSKDRGMISNLFVFEHDGRISNIEILVYSSDKKNMLELTIPTWIYVSEKGVDEFPISSLESVGEFLSYGLGKEYTVKYLSDLLGIKFDSYVWLVDSSENVEEFQKDLSVWSILFDFKYNEELKGHIYSNLPIINLITQVNYINSVVGEYDYEQLDMSVCCLKEVVISESDKQLHFDKRSFDSEFSKYIDDLVSRDAERERVNVEVYNASDISGLASKYARKIRHTGCRILRYDNAPKLYESTVIFVPELEGYENSLGLVRDVMGEGVKLRYERPQFITTGDIVVVLGKDLSE
ncbi:LytR C-terminal domain-containing protein [bacterium]|nr:LytR C-terminal domain-containing protein [bacterium]